VSETSDVFAYFSMNESEYFNFLEKTEGKTITAKLNNLPEVELILPNGQTYQHKGKYIPSQDKSIHRPAPFNLSNFSKQGETVEQWQ
jgi:hypothetical protein